MKIATTLSQVLVRAAGLIQVVLGVLLWAGIGGDLVAVHVLVGLALVIGLWTLGLMAARSGVGSGLVGLALAWGLLVPLVGRVEDRVAMADVHAAIQVLHLLIGLGAVGVAEVLADRIRRRPSPWAGWVPPGPA